MANVNFYFKLIANLVKNKIGSASNPPVSSPYKFTFLVLMIAILVVRHVTYGKCIKKTVR